MNITSIQKHYDIHLRQLPSGLWEAVDFETYDDEPGAALNLHGHGETTAEAIADLLSQLGSVAANDPGVRHEA